MYSFSGSSEKIGREENVKNLSNVESNRPNTLAYPKRVFFIISNEFCERFNFYGMKGKSRIHALADFINLIVFFM